MPARRRPRSWDPSEKRSSFHDRRKRNKKAVKQVALSSSKSRASRVDRKQAADLPGKDSLNRRSENRTGAKSSRNESNRKRNDRHSSSNRSARDQAFNLRRPRSPRIETVPLTAVRIKDEVGPELTFAELGLGERITIALGKLGAVRPFALQSAAIPAALSGRHVLGKGKTGSGKTIAFSAPLVERLLRLSTKEDSKRFGRSPRALVLAPTRELALQIDQTVQPMARAVGLFTTQLYGGSSLKRQIGALDRGVDIVIGTPGRIEDLVGRGKLNLSYVIISVVDEADHMSDLGFIEPVSRILRLTSREGQRLMFSATLDSAVEKLMREFMREPAVFEISGEDAGPASISHELWLVDHRKKRDLVAELAKRSGRILIFTRTKVSAEELKKHLGESGVEAVALHGDMKQTSRVRNLERLAAGHVKVLVATDVAARGIHVDDINLVLQVEEPDDFKTYLHRAGRTGRVGKGGLAITLITSRRARRLSQWLRQAGVRYREFDKRG